MNKIKIGCDMVDVDVNGVFDRFINNSWYRASGKALREVFSDGTCIINYEYVNTCDEEDIRYNCNNDDYIYKVDVVKELC